MLNYYCSQNPVKGHAMFHLEVGSWVLCVCVCTCVCGGLGEDLGCDVLITQLHTSSHEIDRESLTCQCVTLTFTLNSQVKNSSCGATGGIALTQLASSASSSTRARTCIFLGHPISPPPTPHPPIHILSLVTTPPGCLCQCSSRNCVVKEGGKTYSLWQQMKEACVSLMTSQLN